MENFLFQYAPIILGVIYVVISIKLFARSQELTELKSDLMQYAIDHFVMIETYRSDRITLQNMQNDISEIKNLLINMASNNIGGKNK